LVRNVRVHDCRRRVSGRVERSCAHAWVRRGCVGSGPEGETSRARGRSERNSARAWGRARVCSASGWSWCRQMRHETESRGSRARRSRAEELCARMGASGEFTAREAGASEAVRAPGGGGELAVGAACSERRVRRSARRSWRGMRRGAVNAIMLITCEFRGTSLGP